MAIEVASVLGSTGDRRLSIPTPAQLRLLERDDLQPRVEPAPRRGQRPIDALGHGGAYSALQIGFGVLGGSA